MTRPEQHIALFKTDKCSHSLCLRRQQYVDHPPILASGSC